MIKKILDLSPLKDLVLKKYTILILRKELMQRLLRKDYRSKGKKKCRLILNQAQNLNYLQIDPVYNKLHLNNSSNNSNRLNSKGTTMGNNRNKTYLLYFHNKNLQRKNLILFITKKK